MKEGEKKVNELKIFENEEFGEIRTTVIEGEPWFVGKDIATALGYADTVNALKQHVAEEDKLMGSQNTTPYIIDSLGRKQFPTYINESGLYSLIFGSKLESAKRFKHWVTSKVLPSLRKNGGYIVGQEHMTPEQIMAAGLKAAESIIESLKTKNAALTEDNKRMRPKEIFADAVSSSHTTILIGDLAKLLKQNGYETGQKRLFEQLRNEGYLIKSGVSRNMPTQKSMEMGLFEIKETSIANPDGSVRITRTTKVTGKGQQYFVNKMLGGIAV